MAAEGMLPFSIVSVVEDVLRQQGSDIESAAKKTDEEASRRYEAAEWLRKIVGVVYSKDLPAEPSEQDFRLGLRSGIILCTAINKVKPGSIPKVVDPPNHTVIIPDSIGLSGSQYFENVKNFLKAGEDMGLPTFEASDLEQGGHTTKVVDSVLALKSFHDWKAAGGIGTWKYNASAKPPIPVKPVVRKNSEPISNSVSRSSSLSERSLDAFCSEQYSDIDFSDMNGSRSLKLMIRSLLKDRKPDEIPNIIECMLSRVMEEFESHIVRQNDSEEAARESLVGATPETMSVTGQNISPSDSPKAETQNVSPADSPKAETKIISPMDSPKAVPQNLSPTDSPHAETTQSMCSRDSPWEEMQEKICAAYSPKEEKQTTEGAVIDKASERQQVNKDVRTEKDILLEEKQNLLNKCKSALGQQLCNFQELKGTVCATKETVQLMQEKYQEDFSRLGEHMQTLGHAALGYKKVLEENRKLYNQVQDLKGNIRVYCRVRPFLPGQENGFTTVEHIGDRVITISTPSKYCREGKKSFTFNKVFGPAATQAEVFADMQPLVRSVLDGYNVCIFAYGQTGAGKTYTMTGPNDPTEEAYGVNYRALNDLFFLSEDRKGTIRYEVSVQMMEIYNEQVRDLLTTDSSNKKLEICNSSQNGINVPDASRLPVSTTEDVINLMNLGHKNRAMSSTAMNERSSRSHSCMTVHVQGKDLTSGATIRGCMHLVDLAGSERVDKSEVTGDRLKEAQHINKSLSALGDVIASLATKNAHVPYRNSKLTQLLQDSLGGQAKTLMFVHISPEADAVGETISTLKFTERVASVELGAARVNKENSDVRELKDQISNLKAALARKEEEVELFICSHAGTPESMSIASSPMHPAFSANSSTASSPVHPCFSSKSNTTVSSPTDTPSRATKSPSSGSHKSPEKDSGNVKNDSSSDSKPKIEPTQQKSRRRSLDPDDILANEANWPPLSAITPKQGNSAGHPLKKEPLGRQKSLGTFGKTQKQQRPFSSLVVSTSDVNSDDNLDAMSGATSDSSEPESQLSRVTSLPNGIGSKIRTPLAKAPAKTPETTKSMIPAAPVRRTYNEGFQAAKNGKQAKRKTGNTK